LASEPALFRLLIGRELALSWRHGADTLAALLFFIIAGSLFPLAIGPAPETLSHLAAGIVWVCALLAAILPLDRLFGADYEDGSLDQLLLTGQPAPLIALAKAISHWLTTGLPLLLAAGPLAIMLQLDPRYVPVLLLGLLPGTLTQSRFGTMGAAIVLGARRWGACSARVRNCCCWPPSSRWPCRCAPSPRAPACASRPNEVGSGGRI
jgi:heme exporter protein B